MYIYTIYILYKKLYIYNIYKMMIGYQYPIINYHI